MSFAWAIFQRLVPGLLLVFAIAAGTPACAQDAADSANGDAAVPAKVIVLEIDGAIGPATTGYVTSGLDRAAEAGAALVVLRMDTPGGLSAAMREIISAILQSPVPVASFVAPTGARAASAGTYISYASHIAAMAPGTTLGAATPVQMGGSSPLPGADTPSEDGESGDGGSDQPDDAKTAKAVNDATAYIRALANLRGRNADWAVQAVREAATLTSDEAAERQVVDLLADDVRDLVAKLDGRTVALDSGSVTLQLANAQIERMPPDWRDQILSILTDPNVAFILMMLGVYGLIFEFANPGAIVPGVLGAIFLLLGLYALNVLPVNYAGLALIGAGVAFMVAEAFVPSFGALGLGGLAAFALGATILFDTGSGAYQLSYWTIGGVTALTGAILVLLIGVLVKSQRRPVATGEDTLLGQSAEVVDWQTGKGRVRLHGEYWNAIGPDELIPGTEVFIVGRHGLELEVTLDTPAGETTKPAGA